MKVLKKIRLLDRWICQLEKYGLAKAFLFSNILTAKARLVYKYIINKRKE